MENIERVLFTEEMRKDYTLLVPTMLPIHFRLICRLLNHYGYKAELMESDSEKIKEYGLKYVHNDACYPALLVIGQMIEALESGKYDPHKVAFLYFQTGGGCRASNYVSLMRKAFARAGYPYVPIISINFVGMEKNPGFKLTLPMLIKAVSGILYGDLLMELRNQCRPYERTPGSTEALVREWESRLADDIIGHGFSYRHIKDNYRKIVRSFASLPMDRSVQKPKVGIVGEIFVKFSPLGNNKLEEFLVKEGAQPVLPGLMEFVLYIVYNNIADSELYGGHRLRKLICSIVYRYLINKQNDVSKIIAEEGTFDCPLDFDEARKKVQDVIGLGVKMGEGWLLTAEMLSLINDGIKNVVITQPFGCLPNHICGKGMMKPLKEKYPDVNLVAVDYDPGATKINQENRIKLMLSNALPQEKTKQKEFATV
ncbi:MAG: 2-hydroxyacyl-CoA dehydratase [Clostridia bacterium]|nr:2-hydroxyacyl-CoA dehydratase [Clostridia bacterium]